MIESSGQHLSEYEFINPTMVNLVRNSPIHACVSAFYQLKLKKLLNLKMKCLTSFKNFCTRAIFILKISIFKKQLREHA